jgi:hypothetical protein
MSIGLLTQEGGHRDPHPEGVEIQHEKTGIISSGQKRTLKEAIREQQVS